MFMEDEISRKILVILEKSKAPLETREIEKHIPEATRAKVMYRLNDLRGEGKIKGKRVGAGGKGVWVWWSHSRDS
jgi:DNA-binding Lrp family transcriptional regulator